MATPKAKTSTKSTWPTASTAPTGPTAGLDGPDAIKIRHPVRGQDASGARVIRYEDWEPDVLSATVVPVKAAVIGKPQNHQEGMLIRYKIIMSTKLHFRDQILWLATGDIFMVYRVMYDLDTSTWDHMCGEWTN